MSESKTTQLLLTELIKQSTDQELKLQVSVKLTHGKYPFKLEFASNRTIRFSAMASNPSALSRLDAFYAEAKSEINSSKYSSTLAAQVDGVYKNDRRFRFTLNTWRDAMSWVYVEHAEDVLYLLKLYPQAFLSLTMPPNIEEYNLFFDDTNGITVVKKSVLYFNKYTYCNKVMWADLLDDEFDNILEIISDPDDDFKYTKLQPYGWSMRQYRQGHCTLMEAYRQDSSTRSFPVYHNDPNVFVLLKMHNMKAIHVVVPQNIPPEFDK